MKRITYICDYCGTEEVVELKPGERDDQIRLSIIGYNNGREGCYACREKAEKFLAGEVKRNKELWDKYFK